MAWSEQVTSHYLNQLDRVETMFMENDSTKYLGNIKAISEYNHLRGKIIGKTW